MGIGDAHFLYGSFVYKTEGDDLKIYHGFKPVYSLLNLVELKVAWIDANFMFVVLKLFLAWWIFHVTGKLRYLYWPKYEYRKKGFLLKLPGPLSLFEFV